MSPPTWLELLNVNAGPVTNPQNCTSRQSVQHVEQVRDNLLP
jgi:hypothetical protein